MKLLAVVLLSLAPVVGALEPEDTRGLSIELEGIPEPVLVDGLAMRIRLARGSDVPILAQRIEQRWRTEGGALQHTQLHGWKMLSRWQEGRSEVIQWKGVGDAAQMLFSNVDTMQRQAKPARPPFVLPSSCKWGGVIEGGATARRYSQRSANCSSPLAQLLPRLRKSLATQGWVIRHEAGAAMDVTRDDMVGRVIVMPARAPDDSALVWIGVHASRGARD